MTSRPDPTLRPDVLQLRVLQQQRGFAAPPLGSSPSEEDREKAAAAAASALARARSGGTEDVADGLTGMMPTPVDVRVPARVGRR